MSELFDVSDVTDVFYVVDMSHHVFDWCVSLCLAVTGTSHVSDVPEVM